MTLSRDSKQLLTKNPTPVPSQSTNTDTNNDPNTTTTKLISIRKSSPEMTFQSRSPRKRMATVKKKIYGKGMTLQLPAVPILLLNKKSVMIMN